MKHEITKGWLRIEQPQVTFRIRLADVSLYSHRDGKVIIQTPERDMSIDCDPDPQFMARALKVAGADPVKKDKAAEDKQAHAEEARETAASIVASLDAYFETSDGKVLVTVPAT